MAAIEYEVTHSELNANQSSFRVRVVVTRAEGVSKKIFAYLMNYAGPGLTEGLFSHVCSPADLAEYPEDAPTPNVRPEWYRDLEVDVELYSLSETLDFLERIAEDIQALETAIAATLVIAASVETYIVGAFTEESSSSSSGSSEASSESSESPGDLLTATGTGTLLRVVADEHGVAWGDLPAIDTGALVTTSVTLAAGTRSKPLMVQGFEVAGVESDPEGVTVTVRCKSTAAGSRLSVVGLFNPRTGQLSPTTHAIGIPTPDLDDVDLGSGTETWAASLQGADVIRGDFGVLLVAEADSDAVVTVDGVTVEIAYYG